MFQNIKRKSKSFFNTLFPKISSDKKLTYEQDLGLQYFALRYRLTIPIRRVGDLTTGLVPFEVSNFEDLDFIKFLNSKTNFCLKLKFNYETNNYIFGKSIPYIMMLDETNIFYNYLKSKAKNFEEFYNENYS
jgi:hypothetical protein